MPKHTLQIDQLFASYVANLAGPNLDGNAAIGTALYQLRQEIDFGESQQTQFNAWMKAA